jgi:hypothetical protein
MEEVEDGGTTLPKLLFNPVFMDWLSDATKA